MVLAQDRLTDDVYRLTVEATTDGSLGQFYMLRAWERESLLVRPISIHDADEDTINLLYRVLGRGTELLTRLDEGAQFGLTRPPLNDLALDQSGAPP